MIALRGAAARCRRASRRGVRDRSPGEQLEPAVGGRDRDRQLLGGVHRGAADSFDESEDLSALARYPVAVVSAGAKAILDLPLTREALEAAPPGSVVLWENHYGHGWRPFRGG